MAVTSIVITDATRGLASVIKPRAGVAWQGLQFDPTVRAVEEDRVGGDGSKDSTAALGAGVLTLSLALLPPNRAFLDEIGQYLLPWLRPVLTVDDDEWDGPRQATLRFDSASKPIQAGAGLRRDLALSFKVPNGRWEAANPITVAVSAFLPSSTGFVFDVGGTVITSAGYIFPATAAATLTQVVSAGNMASDWQALLYGPATGPRLANNTLGAAIEFTSDVVLAAGDYILLDSATHTAYLNSDRSSPMLQFLNFNTLNWWQIMPGLNALSYYPTAAGGGSQAVLTFRPAWLP